METFAGLDTYLDMLNKAAQIGDTELIGHISGKAAAILNSYAMIANDDATMGAKG